MTRISLARISQQSLTRDAGRRTIVGRREGLAANIAETSRLVLILALCGCAAPTDEPGPPQQGSATRFLTEPSADDYARVLASRPFRFPEDHAAHEKFRSEWWYFTGNLRTRQGRHFGFELTFFRFALAPETMQRTSKWATNQAWMAHLSVTDTDGEQFITAERFSRQALGLAGSQAHPFRVWLEDWSAYGDGDGIPPLRLRAGTDRTGLQLTLDGSKPVALHGDNGVDPKGPERGNASYYYSLSRLDAAGTLRVADVEFDVSGTAWMDREWGTSALSPELTGWDWFGLQLEDGREIMYYRLRTRDGESSPFSGGSLLQADGTRVGLSPQDVSLTPLEYWTSPDTGSSYPVSWQVDLPSEEMALTISPHLPQQELDLTVRYWEGAVSVTGNQRGEEITGDGYVELTGY